MRLGADQHELGAALAEREEEREQRRADEQPGRDPDVDRIGARRRADDEERRDRHHVDQHECFRPERVGGLQRDEAGEEAERDEAERAPPSATAESRAAAASAARAATARRARSAGAA